MLRKEHLKDWKLLTGYSQGIDMGVAHPIITNFTAGESSPRFNGRVDLGKYQNACKTMLNSIVFPIGGATQRGGTKFIAEVKDSTKKVRLIPFEFSTTQAYILEFGENYIRFYRNQGQIESAPSTPYEISTTYTEAELDDIQFAQSADTMYIAHKDHAPAKLTRTGHTSWALNNITFTATPSTWAAANYPQTVAFFEQRLWWAGTPNEPQTLWASKSGDYENHTTGTGDSDALEYTIATDRVNVIQWLSPGKVLTVGTVGGEFIVSASAADEAITPTNVRIVRQSTYGSAKHMPIRISDVILFIQRAGRKLRQLVYQWDSDSYIAPDMSILSEHITVGGISQMAYQQEPFGISWIRRDDGVLLAFTYLRDQEVFAWSRNILGGVSDASGNDTKVETVATIPSTEVSDEDELWVVAQRYINGATKRYIEVMSPGLKDEWDQEDAFYVDSGLTYDGSPATTISGLDHLEGESVAVLADGAALAERTVSSGQITLDKAASKVHAGLGYRAIIEPMQLEAGAADGTSQGRTKRISELAIRMYRTLGLKVGPDLNNLDTIYFRSSADSMDSPPALFTGDKFIPMPSGFDREANIVIVQDQPLPMTVLAIMPKVRTNG